MLGGRADPAAVIGIRGPETRRIVDELPLAIIGMIGVNHNGFAFGLAGYAGDAAAHNQAALTGEALHTARARLSEKSLDQVRGCGLRLGADIDSAGSAWSIALSTRNPAKDSARYTP